MDSGSESSSPSSPPLEGYNTAGEEHFVSSGDERSPAQPRRHKQPKRLLKRAAVRVRSTSDPPLRDAKGRFRRRSNTSCSFAGGDGGGSGDTTPAPDLCESQSLAWDGYNQPLNHTASTWRWSVETQFSVPAAGGDSDEALHQRPALGCSGSISSEVWLPIHPERGASAASGKFSDFSLDSVVTVAQPAAMAAPAARERHRDQVERALLEIEDNIVPFKGRKVTAVRAAALSEKAAILMKILQDGHLFFDLKISGIIQLWSAVTI